MIAIRYHSLCEEIPHVLQVRSEHRVLGRAKTVRGGPAPKVNPLVCDISAFFLHELDCSSCTAAGRTYMAAGPLH